MHQLFRNSLLVTVLSACAIAACGDGTQESLTGGGDNAAPGDPGTTDPGTTSGGTSGTTTSGGTSGTTTSGGTSGTPATDGGKPPPAPAGAGLPCNISAILAAKCTSCHSNPPINGSLSGLVTIGDLLATAKEDNTKNEAQLSLARMQNAASPMPPASVGNPPTAADIAAFQAWIAGNYQGSCDAGAPPPPPTDAFTGAGAFVSQSGGSGKHNAGKNCMGGCHNHGFTFAGTLTDGAGNAVPNAEVRLVDANNKAILVHSGNNGNFYSSSSWTPPAHVAARTAANKVVMISALTTAANGGCNGCHVTGGTASRIHVP
jgi:hypothetical protein